MAIVRTYETLYILKPGLSGGDGETIHTKIDDVISKFNGKVINRDDWGMKELAYAIDNQRMGQYVILHYTGDAGVVEEIERHFKISPLVLRYLTTISEANYDYAAIKRQIHTADEENKKAREGRDARRSPRGERSERY